MEMNELPIAVGPIEIVAFACAVAAYQHRYACAVMLAVPTSELVCPEVVEPMVVTVAFVSGASEGLALVVFQCASDSPVFNDSSMLK